MQPGHFYWPIPPQAEFERDAPRIFGECEIQGIDLREAAQLELLADFGELGRELPFPAESSSEFRYYFENPAFSYSDAIFLHCMLRRLRPRRVVEVGAGFSSAMLLDTCERWLGGDVACTFIEPHPERLRSLLRSGDAARVTLLEQRLQDTDLALFQTLEAGDVLLIDSTHVARTGSDVNFVLFEVLPALAPGVHVHFHDIHYPFEYPLEWVRQGRAWNEVYALRAFLQFNSEFRIVVWNGFLASRHRALLEGQLPLCLRNPGAGLWIERTGV